jgi:hypothetical protein
MTTLAADNPRVFETGHDNHINELPVIASDIIYLGAAVGENGSGYYRPLQGGDPFEGFAVATVDNSSGSAADKNVKVYQRGVATLSVTGVTAVTDEGSTVYATDDDTFTLTASGATAIGKIIRYVSGTTVQVLFEAVSVRSI